MLCLGGIPQPLYGHAIPCFDLSGTLVDHQTRKALPLANGLLRSLKEHGREAYIASRYSGPAALDIATKAGLAVSPDRVIHAGRRSEAVREIARREGVGENRIIVIDDKPDNLIDVRLHTEAAALGMLGSGRYSDRLGLICRDWDFPLAFTPVNLCEALGASIAWQDCQDYSPDHTGNTQRNSHKVDALVWLVAGLVHPMSPVAGETPWFDHRWVTSRLLEYFENASIDRLHEVLPPFWRRMALMLCDECMWKIHVRTVLMSAGVEDYDWAHPQNKAHEITSMLQASGYAASDPVQQALRQSIIEMLHGLLGCWVGGREWQNHLGKVFGGVAEFVSDADVARRLRGLDWGCEDSVRSLARQLESRWKV